jgi:hypothetical protein
MLRILAFKYSKIIAERFISDFSEITTILVPVSGAIECGVCKVQLVQKGGQLLLEVKRDVVPAKADGVVFLKHGLVHR